MGSLTPILALPYPAGTDAADVPYWNQQLALGVESALASAWQAYTPTWSASGGGHAIGNGSLVGARRLVGKTCYWRIVMTIGTSTAAGTGVWSWGLPFAMNGSMPLASPVGQAGAFDASASSLFAGNVLAISGTGVGVIDVGAAANARWQNGTPFSIASTDTFVLSGVYETS